MFDTAPDHSLPQELLMFRDSIRRFVERELMPLERFVTIDGKLPPEHEAEAADGDQGGYQGIRFAALAHDSILLLRLAGIAG